MDKNRPAQSEVEGDRKKLTDRHEKTPDDFYFEGDDSKSEPHIPVQTRGDQPYVRVDNPDDFE